MLDFSYETRCKNELENIEIELSGIQKEFDRLIDANYKKILEYMIEENKIEIKTSDLELEKIANKFPTRKQKFLNSLRFYRENLIDKLRERQD